MGFSQPTKDPFPLQMHDPMVRALTEGGHDGLAGRLSYELNAQKGNSLSSHFNAAAGGDVTGALAAHRMATATERVKALREEATAILGNTEDHDGGGAPGSVAAPSIDESVSAFENAASPAPAMEQDTEPAPAVAKPSMGSGVPRAPWAKLASGK
jgi:hypothetical protein